MHYDPDGEIIVTCGSIEGIAATLLTLTQPGDEVILPTPSYASYQEVVRMAGCIPRFATLREEDNFAFDLDAFERCVSPRTSAILYCNPNNPTGNIIPKQEIKSLLESIPPDITVLIDEAYHHFVTNSDYATSVPYVLEGRSVIVTRTFSKIAALAGMRLGYGLAPKELIERLRAAGGGGGLNAIVKYGGVAALKDTLYEKNIKQMTIDLREKTIKNLRAWGYEVIPSEANFFMVDVGKDVTAVAEDFKKKKVLVGRKFPPMNNWLRVSVGTEPEMARFMAAFKEMFPAGGIKKEKKEAKATSA